MDASTTYRMYAEKDGQRHEVQVSPQDKWTQKRALESIGYRVLLVDQNGREVR